VFISSLEQLRGDRKSKTSREVRALKKYIAAGKSTYAVPAGRFMFALKFVGELFEMPHCREERTANLDSGFVTGTTRL
jgi:hypothetical protein